MDVNTVWEGHITSRYAEMNRFNPTGNVKPGSDWQKVKAWMQGQDKKLADIFKAISSRFDSLETDVGSLKTDVGSLKEKMDLLVAKIDLGFQGIRNDITRNNMLLGEMIGSGIINQFRAAFGAAAEAAPVRPVEA